MKITQEEALSGEVVLALEIGDDRLNKHIDIASKRVSQSLDIPGFRRGKAPRSILINHLGRDYLVEESLKSLVPEAVEEAIADQSLEAFATPRVDIEEIEPNIKLRATVPLRPSVEIGDYRALRFDDEPEQVSDDDVDAVLERIRMSNGYTRTVEREAEMGDVVVFTGKVASSGQTLFEVEDREILLDPENRVGIAGFAESFIGMAAGESKDYQSELERGTEDDGAGGEDDEQTEESVTPDPAMADVHVEVSEVKEVVLPDLDDDLAKTYGQEGLETLDALKERIRQDLETESERRLVHELEVKVVDALVEGSEFGVSSIIVEREGRNLMDRELQRQQALMGGRGPRMRAEDIKPESFEAAEQAAGTRIRQALVIDKIAELEQIEVSDEDVVSELQRINDNMTAQNMPALEDSDENRDSIRENLRGRRTLDLAVRIARGMELAA